MSKPFRILVMYVMYIRRVYGRAFSRSSSLSDGFNKPICLANNRNKIPRPPTHVRLCTLGLLFKGRFVPSSTRVERLALYIRCTPSFPFGLFSHHSNRGNSLQDYPSFVGETVGTRIDRGNSLIMPLRLRGGYATECHAFSYCSSSSALIFSPPLRLVFSL